MKTCSSCKERFVSSELDELVRNQVTFLRANGFTEAHGRSEEMGTSQGASSPGLAVPPVTECSLCRLQRMMNWKNSARLYRRKCDATGKEIISVFHQQMPIKVYESKVWWSDDWDGVQYGREVDFSRPFFEQFAELFREVPFPALSVVGCDNSEFSHNTTNSRNCYLVFQSRDCEDTLYSYGSFKVRDSLDIWWSANIELSSEILSSSNLYNCHFCENSNNSNNLFLCNYCDNCNDCLGCFNLNRRSFCILNQQYAEAEYREIISRFNTQSYSEVEKFKLKVEKFFSEQLHPAVLTERSEECWGDNIIDSKNCYNCFSIAGCHTCSNLFESGRVSSGESLAFCYDIIGPAIESCFGTHLSNCGYLLDCHNCADTFYSINCLQSEFLLGCVGLRRKKHFILNKAYSELDYQRTAKRVLELMQNSGELGQFFPTQISPFAYNESSANDYFAMDCDTVRELGLRWSDYEPALPQADKVLAASDLPDSINSGNSTSLEKKAVQCSASGKLFRFTKQELALYSKMNRPLPRLHPDVRHQLRASSRSIPSFSEQQCSVCAKAIQAPISRFTMTKIGCKECFAAATV